MSEFTELPLKPALFQGLDALGHVTMTPIQAQSLPSLIAGRDLIAQAPTGSGKTAAFGLAALHRIDASDIRLQALVLCPTRELADQVGKQIRKLATGIPNLKLMTITGGVALAPQLASLQHAPHVVVGTPGRVQELMRKKLLDLRGVSLFVLDEADRMLDMGFEDAIREIIGKLPSARQTLLFSATLPDSIRTISRSVTRDALEITVVNDADESVRIEQRFFEVELAQKPAALAGLLYEHRPASAVVFCNTRSDTAEVNTSLQHLGFSALALHGDMEQRDRDEVLVRFANGSCNVLVASDVASRGIDVEALAAVINYELPTDPDVYVHRIGRTARAGRSGLALSLATPREMSRAPAIELRTGVDIRWEKAPLAGLRAGSAPAAPMCTLRIDAGRSDKLRPGDIVGALTGDSGLPADALGRIDIFATRSYVAIQRRSIDKALARLQAGTIKGRKRRARRL